MTIHANNEYINLFNKNNVKLLFKYIFTIVKLFIFVGLGGGLLFGIFRSIIISSFDGLIDGIIFGGMLALVSVPIIILIDISQKLKCYLKYWVINFDVNQERRFLIENDYASVFNKLCEMLNDLKKIEIYNKDMENGIIEAIAKKSWRSFGEKIKIKLLKISRNRVVVVLSSKPKISLTMIDYCKNFENIEMIMSQINQIQGL